ncbi:MobF family relaxase [Comamonas testosteroni]|uniref:MobF family relaxase n=1 Tax=Comamonas testosteroni TaxID=285 RepID=UPI00265E2920|nr:MobF family relaxase [Comamonas testosteroni]WKL14306.1 MobF family relaxase [Comamonas testosteroni]
MLLIEKSGKGVFDYLKNEEEKHNTIKDELTDAKIKNAVFAKYLDGGNKEEHFKAVFKGGLAEELKIDYSTENFQSLMAGECPEKFIKNYIGDKTNFRNGNQFINKTENQQLGTDFVSAPPKSVSMEFALSNYEGKQKIVSALRETDDEINKFLAKNIKPSCRKDEYENFNPAKTKIMFASFTHYEDREIDPHLHNHGLLFNFAEFTFEEIVDGKLVETKKLLAIDTDEVFKKQLEMSSMYDTILNAKMREKGYVTEGATTEAGHKTFRLSGYTEEQENGVSKRSKEIKKFIDEQKEKGIHFASLTMAEAEYKKQVRVNTRNNKEELTTQEIWEKIKEETKKVMSPVDIFNKEFKQSAKKQEIKEYDINQVLNSSIFETSAIVKETEIKKEIAIELRFSKSNFSKYEDLENAVNQEYLKLFSDKLCLDKLVKLEDGKITKLSTIENERKALDNLKELSKISNKENNNFNNQYLDYFSKKLPLNKKLNDGQLNACKLVAEDNQLTIVIGDAGSGKTSSVIKFAVEQNQNNKRKIYGLSTQTTTADALNEAGIEKDKCLNTKSFISKAFNGNKIKTEFIKEVRNSVLIIDEAGMVGAEDYRKITQIALETNSKLIIVGDQKQLSAVSYGSTFQQIQEQIDVKSIARLEENMRQSEGSAKIIAEAYRDKKIEVVFDELTKNNFLVSKNSQEEVLKEIVKDYLNDSSNSKKIICGTNKEIDFVNEKCREAIIQEEINKSKLNKKYVSHLDFKNQKEIKTQRYLPGGVTQKIKKQFCIGEEIIFLKNHKKTIKNGNIGKIKSMKEVKGGFEISVNIENKEVVFNTVDYSYFNHSHAISSHKSQGKTFDNTYHLGSANTSSNKSYVDGSRHKKQYKLYIEKNKIEAFKKSAARSEVKSTTVDSNAAKNAYEKYLKLVKSGFIVNENNNKNISVLNNNLLNEIKINNENIINEIEKEAQRVAEAQAPRLPKGVGIVQGAPASVQAASLAMSMAMSKTSVVEEMKRIETLRQIDEAIAARQKAAEVASKQNRNRGLGR